VSEQQNSSAAVLDDDGVGRIEDAFRKATFDWVRTTKKMVDVASCLGKNTRVAQAALADVEHARDMLDSLYLPLGTKSPAAASDGKAQITVAEVQESVSRLAHRLMVLPPEMDVQIIAPRWSEPVHPNNGKMQWAGVDCPKCPSKASQRCQKDDGGFVEKPHKERKELADQGQNT